MQELYRTNLYKWTINYIRNGRNFLGFMSREQSIIPDQIDQETVLLFELNLFLLTDIENLFNVDNRDIIDSKATGVMLIEPLIRNLRKIENNKYFDDLDIDRLLTKIINQNIYYAFNSLINFLSELNNKFMSELNIKINNKESLINENQVFLSHAFDDKLYTYALFLYMHDNGINLYVDWLFNEKMKNGILLKNKLWAELERSNQLLFLRTVNSELKIKGSGNIRPWCSWELGSYYSIHNNNKNNKFYIEMYDRPGFKWGDNLQLDGINPLRYISDKKLW